MKLTLPNFDLIQDSNLVVRFFMSLRQVISKDRRFEERLKTIAQQLAQQAANCFSNRVDKRKSKLDSEQYAAEVLSLEDDRLSFPENVNGFYKSLCHCLKVDDLEIECIVNDADIFQKEYNQFLLFAKRFSWIKIKKN